MINGTTSVKWCAHQVQVSYLACHSIKVGNFKHLSFDVENLQNHHSPKNMVEKNVINFYYTNFIIDVEKITHISCTFVSLPQWRSGFHLSSILLLDYLIIIFQLFMSLRLVLLLYQLLPRSINAPFTCHALFWDHTFWYLRNVARSS